VNEHWRCPSCGFHNEYDELRCASCDTPRPTATQTWGVPEEPVDDAAVTSYEGPVFTSYLGDLDYLPKPLDQPSYAPRPDYEAPTEPTFQAPAAPTYDRVPGPTPQPLPSFGSAPTTTKKRFPGRPLSRRPLTRFLPIAVLAVVAGVLSAALADREGATTVTVVTYQPVVTEATYLPPATEFEDVAYAEELATISQDRDELIRVTNERWNTWLALEDEGFPPAEYLVMDELEAFWGQVAVMTLPVSDMALSLHEAWTADLNDLVTVEQLLIAEPSQENLDAELAAWGAETESFSQLYEYLLSGG
jgi:hypothetical protein